MIAAHDLCYRYARASRPALNGVTFSVPSGSIALLCGANGSGKSTLLRLLSGLLRPGSGSLRISRCAFVMQDADRQILGGTVYEDMLIPWPRPSDEQREKARELAAAFGLAPDADARRLSGGQKRRLCIASALMTDPETLLLDEPSNSLDYPSCCRLIECLGDLRGRGMTIMLSTHDPALFAPAMQDEDLVFVLRNGGLCALLSLCGAGNAIREHPEWGVRPWT